MKKISMFILFVMSFFVLTACDVFDLAREIINDPPVVEGAFFNKDEFKVELSLSNLPENGEIVGIVINGEEVIFEEKDGVFLFSPMPLKDDNRISSVIVRTDQRHLNIPMNYDLNGLIKENISDIIDNVLLSFEYSGEAFEGVVVIETVEDLENFIQENKDAINLDENVVFLLNSSFKVLESFMDDYTLIVGEYDRGFSKQYNEIESFSVNNGILEVRLNGGNQSNQYNVFVVVLKTTEEISEIIFN